MYTAPARTIPGAPPRSSRPATVTVPDVISPTPMAALTNSRKPEPSSPVRPTSSPSAADNDTGPLSFGVVTRFATNTGGPPRRLRSATLAISRVAWSPSSASSTIADCPAISSASMDAVTPLAGWVHSTWPFFRAVKSSQKAVMSVGLWVTTSIVTPVSSLSRRTRSRNLSSSCRGRLDVGSSMTSRSALAAACSWPPAPSSSVTPARIIARATHSMTRSASGSRCTSALTGRSRPTVAIAARARDRAAAMLMSPSLFRRNEFTSRLSSTDRFSASPRSWNTAATRGLRAGRPCGPSPSTIRYDPWSAGITPARILTSVDFPDPLCPMMPCTVPRDTLNDTPISARTAPMLLCTSSITSRSEPFTWTPSVSVAAFRCQLDRQCDRRGRSAAPAPPVATGSSVSC